MTLTDTQKQRVNSMCPIAQECGIGDILQAVVEGAASGYKVARGESSVSGTADVDTGLSTVVAVVASLGEDPVVGEGMWVTAAIGATAGHIDLKVWKPTANNDCTPVAGSAAKEVDWIAIGT